MFVSYFKIIFAKYFSYSIFWPCFLFPNSSRSVPPNLTFFHYFSKKKQKRKINKPKTVRQKMSKQNKKKTQDNMEFILHWPTISRHGPALEFGWHLLTVHWEKQLIFISKQTSIANSFLLGVELCLHFPFQCWDFCLVWTCTGLEHTVMVSVSSFMHQQCCVWKTTCPWSDISALAPLPLLSHRHLS